MEVCNEKHVQMWHYAPQIFSSRLYRVIKKSLCTWWVQYKKQVHRDFLITLFKFTKLEIGDLQNIQVQQNDRACERKKVPTDKSEESLEGHNIGNVYPVIHTLKEAF